MKKLSVAMVAAMLVMALSAVAQDDTVTSVNVVGYYSITIPANGIALLTPVLESFESGTVEDMVGDQLPNLSTAYIWDRIQNTYLTAGKNARGAWSGAYTNLILRGDAVWIKPGGTNETTLTFVGEVPAAYNMAGTTTVANISGADAVGYSYPVDRFFTNTTLATALPNLSTIYMWDKAGQTYVSYGKNARGAWSAGTDVLEIKAGEAFWVSTPTPLEWEEVAPYTLD